MKAEGLLAELEDLLRTTPPQSAFGEQENDEALSWLGRAAAVLKKWESIESIGMESHISALQGEPHLFSGNQVLRPHGPAYRGLRTLLFQAQHDLRMKTVGPLSTAIPAKKPFVYFDEIRKIIEQSREDLLFVDPYLDPEFISRYLPQIKGGVMVRLLTSKEKLSSLLPAVESFVAESKLQVKVRSVSSGLHDRFVFVDKRRCFQSGASFKDGARKSPTALTQITDIFKEMLQGYETMWDGAETEFPSI